MGTLGTPDLRLRVIGRLYTIPETAQILRVKQQTVRLWACRGKLTVVHVGRSVRIPESSLHDLIARGYQQSTE